MRHDPGCFSLTSLILQVVSGATASARTPGGAPLMPMAIPFEDTIQHRGLQKPVLAK